MVPNTQPRQSDRRKKTTIVLLAVGITILFGIIFSQAAFNLTFLRPNTNQQAYIFVALSTVIFLLLLTLTFVLVRTLLKLYAERQSGVLGSKFRTRMVLGALLLSFGPVIFLFLFAYGLMNRSIDKWFSRPVEEVRQDTASVASMLSNYAAQNASAEAVSIATLPDTQRAFQTGNFGLLMTEFRRHDAALRGGFAFALVDNEHAEASYHAPDLWPVLQPIIVPSITGEHYVTRPVRINGRDYMMGTAKVGTLGRIVVAMPLPSDFSNVLQQIEASSQRYLELSAERKVFRRTYMGLLLFLTVLVLFAATWLALFMAKLVTRPVVALAEATQEISRGRFDYRVQIPAADELGQLVHSFNRMAEELEISRAQIESSSRSLTQANNALEQRRRHMETILESIPTGVLSLDANWRITHVNSALQRIFHFNGNASRMTPGVVLTDCFERDVVEDLDRMLRKSDRMGSVTNQMEMTGQQRRLHLAITVSSLHVDMKRLGYVLVFEDLTELLKAQKQAAWREVARRVAHEIKNPLTPIALCAERIKRHLERDKAPDSESLAVIHTCVDTIASAVETVRTLVNEFSALARFPAAQPKPSDINMIVESALAMFDGRLDRVQIKTCFGSNLPLVLADAEAVKRATANLVDNAAEAMQNSLVREIQVSTALLPTKDMVEIVIADTGHGVTQELKEKLFLPYFSTKRRGTGLGLTIVSRIVEEHHGSIRVEENEPVGARFIVELPVTTNTLSEEVGDPVRAQPTDDNA